jgi:chaperonin cofactor prefoldin
VAKFFKCEGGVLMIIGKDKERLDFLEKTIQSLSKDLNDLSAQIEILKKEIDKIKNTSYSKGKQNI